MGRFPRFRLRWQVWLVGWLLGIAAAVITLRREPFGYIVIGGILSVGLLSLVLSLIFHIRQQLRQEEERRSQFEKGLRNLEELLIDVKDGGRFRCSPATIEAWKATHSLRDSGIRAFAFNREDVRFNEEILVIPMGRVDGLVAGMCLGIYETKVGSDTVIVPKIVLEPGMIEDHRTYVRLGNYVTRISVRDPSSLEIRLLDPTPSESGAGELEKLLGRLLLELDNAKLSIISSKEPLPNDITMKASNQQ
jgi:hypothetical protein